MKKICGILKYVVLIGSLIAGLYVGGYLMFVKSILVCCIAINAGTLTGMMAIWTVVKCALAGSVCGAIFGIGYLIALTLNDYS